MKLLEQIKKIDIRNLFIIILAIGLIISFLIGQRNGVNYHKDEIKDLKADNKKLSDKNDSLLKENIYLDKRILELNKFIENNNMLLTEMQNKLKTLKNKRDEIPTYVNDLSANGVANEFTKFLNKNTKSTNTSKRKR